MTLNPYPAFTANVLDDRHVFYCGYLPRALMLTTGEFEDLWSMHPEEYHWIKIHGKLVQTPRWQQAYGADYHYTGRINHALPIPPPLEPAVEWSRSLIDPRLNGILLNWYRGSGHYIGEHHDSTKNMVSGASIVTISFGETRIFRLTKGKGDAKQSRDFPAPSGTVFIMPYDTNRAWKHGVPKSARYTGRRISVTFRAFEQGVLASTTRERI